MRPPVSFSPGKQLRIVPNWWLGFIEQSFEICMIAYGEVIAYAHVTEFQKRGMPHEHFLLIMAKK
jgi:hypothetical protein